jgi:ribonuclease HII
MLEVERKLRRTGVVHIAGVDEAGRGPLAGPVVAAAVIFPPSFFLPAVDDSKRLSARMRERLFPQILGGALAVGIGEADHEEIDQFNILNATFLAMHRAVRSLGVTPGHLLVDGNRFRPGTGETPIPFTTLVGGDARSFSVAAASIVAKVTRDRRMCELDVQYPEYGFAQHKGYATSEHRQALRRWGPSAVHRRTFLHDEPHPLPLWDG